MWIFRLSVVLLQLLQTLTVFKNGLRACDWPRPLAGVKRLHSDLQPWRVVPWNGWNDELGTQNNGILINHCFNPHLPYIAVVIYHQFWVVHWHLPFECIGAKQRPSTVTTYHQHKDSSQWNMINDHVIMRMTDRDVNNTTVCVMNACCISFTQVAARKRFARLGSALTHSWAYSSAGSFFIGV